MQQRRSSRATALGLGWLKPTAIAAVAFASAPHLAALLGLADIGALRKLVLFVTLALPVIAMVLLEQLFRNVPEDARWNIKPLCLGLAGALLFDLYLYSEAVLFNAVDSDGFGVRGAVHALVVPFLVLSTARRSDWLSKIQISRKAAFHSATLMIAGFYLVFVSAVGYYVRYFGGEWGRALQLGLVFLALVVLMVLAVSGSMRARLRVFLGKHFFRYRYDYREEWLRFTQTLSAQNSPQDMGLQVIRGLADMLESPGGGLWLKNRRAHGLPCRRRAGTCRSAPCPKTRNPRCATSCRAAAGSSTSKSTAPFRAATAAGAARLAAGDAAGLAGGAAACR